MRKSLFTATLLMAALAGPALADEYSITLYDPINLTQIDGTGSFTFTGTWFPTFTIDYAGLSFDFTSGGVNYLFDIQQDSADEVLGLLVDDAWYSFASSVPGASQFDSETVLVLGNSAAPANDFGVFDTQLTGACFSNNPVGGVGISCTGGRVAIEDLSPPVFTPEPFSVVLLLTVIAALALAYKRRKNREFDHRSASA